MSDLIDKLVGDTYYNSWLIERSIDQICLKTFPSKTAHNLLKSLKKICSYSRNRLIQLHRDFEQAPDQTTPLIKMIFYFLCHELAPEIRYAEGASLERTPGGLVRALEKFVASNDLGAVSLISHIAH